MKKLIAMFTATSMLMASTVVGNADSNGMFRSLLDSEEPAISVVPTPTPTAEPTATPTVVPTPTPTAVPTPTPTAVPTPTPTVVPTPTPTAVPTPTPTVEPTPTPTIAPSVITGVSLNKQNLELKIGDTFTLVAEIQPEGAEQEEITWVSSDECVQVSDGIVTAKTAGTAVINAVTQKSKYVASCYVSVVDESGMLDLHVSEGVKQVVLTKDGLSTEVTAGITKLEAGTYSVSAKAEENYKLMTYSESVTVRIGEETELAVAAEREKCNIRLPEIKGCRVVPVNGSESVVAVNGSYSFRLELDEEYNSKDLVVKANGEVITNTDGVYTISGITTDITISIDGVTEKSDDTSLKYVKVSDYTATLEGDTYKVVLPYGMNVSISSVAIMPNNLNAEYSVTTVDCKYRITVKAEDGTTKEYTLIISNLEINELDELKLAIEALTFEDITQSSTGGYKSQNETRTAVENLINSVTKDYEGITVSVSNSDATAPVAGTAENPDGTDGYYRYIVEVSDGASTRSIVVEITVYSYKFTVSAADITSTATSVIVQDIEDGLEVALFTIRGGRMRNWTKPDGGKVVFKNLENEHTYVVKVREIGSDETPATGTSVTTKKSAKVSGSRKYYTVTFDEGLHGTIVSGKERQSVRIARAPVYPEVEADDGYIFKGWSLNGVLVEDPDRVQIRSASSFIAIYEKASGASYGKSSGTTQSSAPRQNISTTTADIFYDVPASSWYYNSVKSMTDKGYMNGTVPGKFEPDSTLTRAMLVTVLYRYACEPESEGVSFDDVPKNTWYSDAVAWAADAGIVEGTEAGRFEPESNITREQLAAIMYRYCEAFGYDTSAAGNIIKYSDSYAISDWAQTALIWTTGAGIIDGKDNNMLDPGGKATRAEAATIIERFDNFINE